MTAPLDEGAQPEIVQCSSAVHRVIAGKTGKDVTRGIRPS